MTLKFLGQCLALGVAVAVVAAGLTVSEANAAVKKRSKAPKANSSSSVSYSYQADPRTRVYVTKRSWLDAGPEVSPGERKFTDYANGPSAFENLDRLNSHMDRRRSPLSTPADVGGYPSGFPLY